MIRLATLEKLLCECFLDAKYKQTGPIEVAAVQQVAWFEELGKRLAAIPHVDCNVSHYRHGDERVPGLFVRAVAGEPNRYDYFILKFVGLADSVASQSDGLWLHHENRHRAVTMAPTPIGSLDAVELFVQKLVEQQKMVLLREKRSQKVAGLKQTSLTSQLTTLGQKHNFAFAIGQSKRDVLLSIRVNGRKTGFHFSFAKGKLDSVIDRVPELLAMLDNLQSLGVCFRANNKSWAGKQCDWIEPK